MNRKPIMAMATAVWLVDNSTLTFRQIADFCGMHELEIQGVADGEIAVGIMGFDPVVNNQLDPEELERGQADPNYALKLKEEEVAEVPKSRKKPRYTPLSKRQDRPAAISWLVKNHPELTDTQIIALVRTTKTTITAVRNRTHWNINNIQPTDPVALGLCRQIELDEAVRTAVERSSKSLDKQAKQPKGKVLVPIEESLKPGRVSSTLADLESFKLDSRPES